MKIKRQIPFFFSPFYFVPTESASDNLRKTKGGWKKIEQKVTELLRVLNIKNAQHNSGWYSNFVLKSKKTTTGSGWRGKKFEG